jgi:hypothetical protein
MLLERKPLKCGESIRDILFTGSLGWDSHFPAVFPHLLTASVWTTNIKTLEERLRELRYDTTIDPEMASFNQLTLLRRNIGDMHIALLDAQKRTAAVDALSFRALQEVCGISLSQQDSLEGIFDTLLARNDALSMAVDHEIQLVIASVTVQVLPDLTCISGLEYGPWDNLADCECRKLPYQGNRTGGLQS